MYERLVALDPLEVVGTRRRPVAVSPLRQRRPRRVRRVAFRLRASPTIGRRLRRDHAHLAKYRSLVPSLAPPSHLADDGRDEGHGRRDATGDCMVDLPGDARTAAVLADSGRDAGTGPALAAKIKAGALTDGFTLRDVYRPQWANLTECDEAAAAVDLLIELGWLDASEETTKGRPATVYRINPAVARKTGKAPADELTPHKSPFCQCCQLPNRPFSNSVFDSWE